MNLHKAFSGPNCFIRGVLERAMAETVRGADEEHELKALREMIGDNELARLRPTGSTGVTFPGKERVIRYHPTPADTNQKLEQQEESESWDPRPFRAAELAMSARRESRERSARYLSSRYGPSGAPIISKKDALAIYHRDLEMNREMWRQQRAVEKMEMEQFLEERAYKHERNLKVAKERLLAAAAEAPLALDDQEPGVVTGGDPGSDGGSMAASSEDPGATHASDAAMQRRAPPRTASGKGSLNDEGDVITDGASRRTIAAAAQTSRTDDHQRRGGGSSGYGQSTGRRAKAWTPPTDGWNASPVRNTPYALRGTRPVTDEPWARDAESMSRSAFGVRVEIDRPGPHKSVTSASRKPKAKPKGLAAADFLERVEAAETKDEIKAKAIWAPPAEGWNSSKNPHLKKKVFS